jgi:hypothetical protein
VELLGAWVPTCHNCSARIGALSALPRTLAAIRELLSRERRGLPRRIGKSDGRVFPYERRHRKRRAPRLGRGTGSPLGDPVDEEMIVEIAELASDLDALAAGLPVVSADREPATRELTRIREIPR